MESSQTPEQVLEIIKRFCAKENSRYAISEPFVQGDHVYGTNGRWAARAPLELCAAPRERTPDDMTTPPAHELGWNSELFTEWPEPISDKLPIRVRKPCKACEGTQLTSQTKCNQCGGRGSDVCPECGGPDGDECEKCDGTGKVWEAGVGDACTDCDGRGYCFEEEMIVFSTGVCVNRDFVADLKELGAKLHPTRPSNESLEHRAKPVRFTIGVIEGLVMPLNPTGDTYKRVFNT